MLYIPCYQDFLGVIKLTSAYLLETERISLLKNNIVKIHNLRFEQRHFGIEMYTLTS